MYEQDLALNNPQGLTCHKTYPTSDVNVFKNIVYTNIFHHS